MLSGVVFTLVLLVATTMAFPSKIYEEDDIRFAGAIGGKSFFAIYNPTKAATWAEAGAVCTAMNLRLAEIRTEEQANALKTEFDAGRLLTGPYWVAARDTLTLRRFGWVSSDEDPSSSGLELSGNATSTACLAYHMSPQPSLQFRLCDSYSSFKLCEVGAL